jgi:hypothetical protein
MLVAVPLALLPAQGDQPVSSPGRTVVSPGRTEDVSALKVDVDSFR